MTPQELADYLGVSRRTIYRWIDRGCPCEVRYDGTNTKKYKFDLEQVKAWRRSDKLPFNEG